MLPKATGFWHLSLVENSILLGSIRMEGMQDFANKPGILHANNSNGWTDKETLTYITAKWFLISLYFFPYFLLMLGK